MRLSYEMKHLRTVRTLQCKLRSYVTMRINKRSETTGYTSTEPTEVSDYRLHQY